jgi:hypothetical protein
MRRGQKHVAFYTMSGGSTNESLFNDKEPTDGYLNISTYVFRLPMARRNIDWILAFGLLSGFLGFLVVNTCVLTDIAPIWPPSKAPYAFGYAYAYPNVILVFLFIPAALFQNIPLFYSAYALSLVQLVLNIVAFIYLFVGALLNINNLANFSGLIGSVVMLFLTAFAFFTHTGFSAIAFLMATHQGVALKQEAGSYDRASRASNAVLSMSTLSVTLSLVTIAITALSGTAPAWPPSLDSYLFGYAFIIPNAILALLFIPTAFMRTPKLLYTSLTFGFVQFILNLAAWLYLFIPAMDEIANFSTVNAMLGSIVLILLMILSFYILTAIAAMILLGVAPAPLRLYKHR